MVRDRLCAYVRTFNRGGALETQGPLGTLWAGVGLSAFYIALIWLNTLLAVFLTPLFLIPVTWFVGGKRRRRGEDPDA